MSSVDEYGISPDRLDRDQATRAAALIVARTILSAGPFNKVSASDVLSVARYIFDGTLVLLPTEYEVPLDVDDALELGKPDGEAEQ